MGGPVCTLLHWLIELLNQALDLCGFESDFCFPGGVVLFALPKAIDMFKVVFKVAHCFRKCGMLLLWLGR